MVSSFSSSGQRRSPRVVREFSSSRLPYGIHECLLSYVRFTSLDEFPEAVRAARPPEGRLASELLPFFIGPSSLFPLVVAAFFDEREDQGSVEDALSPLLAFLVRRLPKRESLSFCTIMTDFSPL